MLRHAAGLPNCGHRLVTWAFDHVRYCHQRPFSAKCLADRAANNASTTSYDNDLTGDLIVLVGSPCGQRIPSWFDGAERRRSTLRWIVGSEG
jgi:hypothetical protein